jgi:hypothetical protein
VCEAGGVLPAIAALSAGGLTARLAGAGRTRSLGAPVSVDRGGAHGGARFGFAIPADMPPGLYSLVLLRRGRVAAREPQAVWIPRPGKGCFAFVHLSDFHVVQPGCARPALRAAALRRLVRHLREEVRPDFILETGDVVTRYGRGKRPLSATLIRRQIHAARNALLRLRIPYFLTPGNHDRAFPAGRRLWVRLMGGPWAGARHDYGFTFRGLRFLALDRAVTYDRRNRAMDFRVGRGQKRWLRSELNAARAAGRPVVLFCHYDYTGELARLIRNPPVVKVFYGHKNRTWLPARWAALDGLLNSKLAYQRVRVSHAGRISCEPGMLKAVFLDGVET